MGAAQPHIATHVSQNTIAGADKLSTLTAHAIGAPTGWRTTLHQTRLHDDMAAYTPDTSIRQGPPSRPQALYLSPRISRNGYKCQAEHYCRRRQTQYTHGAHDRRTHRLAHNSAPDTAPRLHTHWTHPLTIPGMASRPPIGYILPRPLQKPRKAGSTSWLTHVAYPGNSGKHNLGPSPATTVYKTPLACHLAANCCGGSTGLRPRSQDKGTPES
jgi:hypothetical protein